MFIATYCTRRGALLEQSTSPCSADLPSATLSKEVNKLICAAVINRSFRGRLLHNPERALAEGCNGESFRLTSMEREHILSISAPTLAEFAASLRASPRPESERMAGLPGRAVNVLPTFAKVDRPKTRPGYSA